VPAPIPESVLPAFQSVRSTTPSAAQLDLYAQLQSILAQLETQNGQPILPKLNIGLDCEETESEETEVIVEVKVTYRSKKRAGHANLCQAARILAGATGTCNLASA